MTRGRRSAEPDFDVVAPDASSMIESLRAFGYDLPTAVADLIDNSISAGAKNVWLTFRWAGPGSFISVTDDGSGMSAETLVNAMRAGSRSPLDPRLPSDLGRFGLGLKTASFSQCRRLTVASREKKGTASIRRWDLDHVQQVRDWQLLRSPAALPSHRTATPAGDFVRPIHASNRVGPTRGLAPGFKPRSSSVAPK